MEHRKLEALSATGQPEISQDDCDCCIGEILAVDLSQIPNFPGEPNLKSVKEALCIDIEAFWIE